MTDAALSTETDDSDLAERIDELAKAMTQFELSLVVVRNAFEQWGLRCASASGLKGYSPMELLVLSMVGYGSKRLADICFSLNIEDTHVVSYALKKLQRAKLVESSRVGKDTLFLPTELGRNYLESYKDTRKRFLIRDLMVFSGNTIDIGQLTDMLRALSGFYQQTARSVENAKAE